MAGLGWLGAIIVGGLAGWIAQKIMNTDNGLFLNIITGIVGAMIFNAILVFLIGATFAGFFGQLVAGTLGACVLIAALRGLRRV